MSKLTKEEKATKVLRREKLKELLGGVINLQGVNNLVMDLRKEIIEMIYDEEMKNHLGAKNTARPEDSVSQRQLGEERENELRRA
ncbi:MAG: hypothetical protein LBC04_01020 [Holosporaceae bacterium]|jgi:hypothetical protein|nr:hypothetical protein [Holosporaceae bacterium]